jgi:hypothetical protein
MLTKFKKSLSLINLTKSFLLSLTISFAAIVFIDYFRNIEGSLLLLLFAGIFFITFLGSYALNILFKGALFSTKRTSFPFLLITTLIASFAFINNRWGKRLFALLSIHLLLGFAIFPQLFTFEKIYTVSYLIVNALHKTLQALLVTFYGVKVKQIK